MVLNKETGMDPPGVRVRPTPGLLTSGCFMGLVENFAKIGYEEKNMYMADYDWRLSFQNTEVPMPVDEVGLMSVDLLSGSCLSSTLGISAAKTLSDAGIKDLLILEASDHIGGRIHKYNFDGIQVEMGANWIEGLNGQKSNPIWEATKVGCLDIMLLRRNFSQHLHNSGQEDKSILVYQRLKNYVPITP